MEDVEEIPPRRLLAQIRRDGLRLGSRLGRRPPGGKGQQWEQKPVG